MDRFAKLVSSGAITTAEAKRRRNQAQKDRKKPSGGTTRTQAAPKPRAEQLYVATGQTPSVTQLHGGAVRVAFHTYVAAVESTSAAGSLPVPSLLEVSLKPSRLPYLAQAYGMYGRCRWLRLQATWTPTVSTNAGGVVSMAITSWPMANVGDLTLASVDGGAYRPVTQSAVCNSVTTDEEKKVWYSNDARPDGARYLYCWLKTDVSGSVGYIQLRYVVEFDRPVYGTPSMAPFGGQPNRGEATPLHKVEDPFSSTSDPQFSVGVGPKGDMPVEGAPAPLPPANGERKFGTLEDETRGERHTIPGVYHLYNLDPLPVPHVAQRSVMLHDIDGLVKALAATSENLIVQYDGAHFGRICPDRLGVIGCYESGKVIVDLNYKGTLKEQVTHFFSNASVY
jgi:hypothetical protein